MAAEAADAEAEAAAAELAKRRAELRANETPEQRKKREVAYAKRLVARAPRGGGFRSEQKTAKAGKGFGRPGSGLKFDRRPKAKESCACGNGETYGECGCSRYHDMLACDAADPAALVRARYTAYRYRLPDFLIATTDPDGEEYQANTREWKKSLLQFCDQMDFQRLVIQDTKPDATPPQVSFRASFVQKG